MNRSVSIALLAAGLTVAPLGCGTSSTGDAGSNGSESGSGEGSGGAPSGSNGSGGGGESDGSGAAPSTGSAPPSTGAVDPNTVYVPEQDPEKAQEIATRMWAILTAPPCWNQDGLPYNYSFFGVNDYRYSGYEITSGQVFVSSVGSFGGYDMADVTISSTQYWIGIYDEQTMAMSFFHDNGALVTSWFTAAAPGSSCV